MPFFAALCSSCNVEVSPAADKPAAVTSFMLLFSAAATVTRKGHQQLLLFGFFTFSERPKSFKVVHQHSSVYNLKVLLGAWSAPCFNAVFTKPLHFKV